MDFELTENETLKLKLTEKKIPSKFFGIQENTHGLRLIDEKCLILNFIVVNLQVWSHFIYLEQNKNTNGSGNGNHQN